MLQVGDRVLLRVVKRKPDYCMVGWCPAVLDHDTGQHLIFRLPSGRMWPVDYTYGPWLCNNRLPDLVARA